MKIEQSEYRVIPFRILPLRLTQILTNIGVTTYEELASKTEKEMLKYRNVGKVKLSELKDLLSKEGLTFAEENWNPNVARHKWVKTSALLELKSSLEKLSAKLNLIIESNSEK